MLHGFKKLSKEKPKLQQLCLCLCTETNFEGEEVMNQFLARWNGRGFYYHEQRNGCACVEDLERVELWIPCLIDADGMLREEMYEIEECDLKQNRYMSKRTIPE